MPGFWGADSLQILTYSVGGTTLANYVINVQYAGSPHDQIVWWGRYFDYGPNEAGFRWQGDAEANALSNAVKGYSNPTHNNCWVLPIASPYNPYNVNGTYSQGAAAGNYVCAHIATSISSRLLMPGNGVLNVYLDVENNAATNANFLQGWADAVNSYIYGGSYPFFACIYINPNNATQMAILKTVTGYFNIWSSEPEPICSGCDSPGPKWGPAESGFLSSEVWQYGEANSSCQSCRGQTIYVDLDQTDPSVQGTYGYGMCDNMLAIHPA